MPQRSALRSDPLLCQLVKERYNQGESPTAMTREFGVSLGTIWSVIWNGPAKPTTLIDLTGNRVGRLSILRRDGNTRADQDPRWIVRCDCGFEKSVSGQSLRGEKAFGRIKGCRCPPATPEEDQKRFWSYVKKGSDCWEWSGSRSPFGYGRMNIRGVIVMAHRFSMALKLGRPLIKGESVLHSCDNPPCVRPEHLRIGTQKDNAADREDRGRGNQPRGSRNGKTIFAEDEIVRIKHMLKSGKLNKGQIADIFECSRSAIEGIASGRTWSHIKIE